MRHFLNLAAALMLVAAFALAGCSDNVAGPELHDGMSSGFGIMGPDHLGRFCTTTYEYNYGNVPGEFYIISGAARVSINAQGVDPTTGFHFITLTRNLTGDVTLGFRKVSTTTPIDTKVIGSTAAPCFIDIDL